MLQLAALLLSQVPLTAALLPAAPGAVDGAVLTGLLPSSAAAARAEAFAAAGRDPSFLPPLLDLLALAETREEWFQILDAVGAIRGEDVREVQRPWRTFQSELASGPAPPVPLGYAGFKGRLLAERVDPEFSKLLPLGVEFDGRLDQLHFGGVGPRGIPALTDPAFVPGNDADHVAGDAPVIGLFHGGEARAYPLQIIDWHEMVNDVIGGTPVALTWCTLCNAAIAYRAVDAAGKRLVFGSSGLLLRSNKVMFDEGTGALWSQLEGRRLSRREQGGGALERIPARMTTWARWLEDHPQSKVLAEDTGHDRDYRVGAAYGDMFVGPRTMFPVEAPADPSLDRKEPLIVIDGRVSVPGRRLKGGEPVDVAGKYVVVGPGRLTEASRHVVVDARAWHSGGRKFRRTGPGDLVDEDGTVWSVTPSALVASTGERLLRVPSHVSFAFAAAYGAR